jgi:hypothetical protein
VCPQRFGLGFNAVFHFTDVPAFVSGAHMVIFDPHARYLPGVSPAQPGLKLSFAGGSSLTAQFPDAFAPFLPHFGCALTGHYPATLFRFPLRCLHACFPTIHLPNRTIGNYYRRPAGLACTSDPLHAFFASL